MDLYRILSNVQINFRGQGKAEVMIFGVPKETVNELAKKSKGLLVKEKGEDSSWLTGLAEIALFQK